MMPPEEVATDRQRTDKSWIYFCIGYLVLTLILVGYSSIYADTDRLFKGYDDCGNICGIVNEGIPFDSCGSHDKRQLPSLFVTYIPNHYNELVEHIKCVEECADGHESCGQGKDAIDAMGSDFLISIPYLALACVIAFLFSYVELILIRHAIKYIIWVIYFGFVAMLLGLAVVALIAEIYAITIILVILALCCTGLLIWFRKKIQLVAKLFKEAAKALIDVPGIMFEPILTYIALIFAFVPFVYFTLLILSAGRLKRVDDDGGQFKADYVPDFAMIAAYYVNYIAFFWFTQFIFGCQHFVVASTICKWYFARDKSKLDSPIRTAFSNLCRFHLGSVCFGSVLITIVKIIRMLFSKFERKLREQGSAVACVFGCLCAWLLVLIDSLLRYLVRNAYIVVARDGLSFLASAKRAFHLLADNLTDVIALNTFGDLVLVFARLFVVGIVGFVTFIILGQTTVQVVWIPVIIAMVFAFLISHCFVSVFEMTVDTIFLCFCIDCEENDGVTRPYFMSEKLKKVMCEMKEFCGGELTFGPRDQMPMVEMEVKDGGEGGFPLQPPAQPPVYSVYPNLSEAKQQDNFTNPYTAPSAPYESYPPPPQKY